MADAQTLAAHCDAVILATRAFQTSTKSLEHVAKELDGFRIIGAVLNGGTPVKRYRYGGYYGNDGYNRNDGYYGNDGYNRNDGYGSNVSQAAFDRGYQEGVRAGQDDRSNNRRYDVQNHNTYRDATAGYNSRYGDRNSYRNSFREGYQRGYDEGYNNRNSGRSGSRGRDILGTIFGRP